MARCQPGRVRLLAFQAGDEAELAAQQVLVAPAQVGQRLGGAAPQRRLLGGQVVRRGLHPVQCVDDPPHFFAGPGRHGDGRRRRVRVAGRRLADRLRQLLTGQPVGLVCQGGQRPGDRAGRRGGQVDRADEADQHGGAQTGHPAGGLVLQGRGPGPDDRADVLLQLPQVVQHRGLRRPPGLRVELQVAPVAGVQRHLLEVIGDLGRAGAEDVVAGVALDAGGVPVEGGQRRVLGRAHRHELQELAALEPARGEHAVEEGPFLRGALLGVAERLQRADAPAQSPVGGAVQAVVDAGQFGDAAGVEGERGRASGGERIGAGAYPGQAVQLPDRPGHPVLGQATGGDQGLDLGAPVVDAYPGRAEFVAETDVAAEQAGGEATFGLQLLRQVLHGQREDDRAGRGVGGAVVAGLDGGDHAEQYQDHDQGQGQGTDDAAADRATRRHRRRRFASRGGGVLAGGALPGNPHEYAVWG